MATMKWESKVVAGGDIRESVYCDDDGDGCWEILLVSLRSRLSLRIGVDQTLNVNAVHELIERLTNWVENNTLQIEADVVGEEWREAYMDYIGSHSGVDFDSPGAVLYRRGWEHALDQQKGKQK